MAPTICSEKEYRSRNRVRESILKHSQNNSNNNNNTNYGGKIIHRRSIAARNAKSIKFSLVNSFENDTTMYENDSMIVNNHKNHHNKNNTIHSQNLLPIRNNEFDENYNVIDDKTSSSVSSSSSTFSTNCDHRLTSNNQFFHINLTENNKINNNLYSYQKQSKFIYHDNESIFYDTSSSTSSSQLSIRNSFNNNTIPEITSTVCIGDSNDMKINRISQQQESISNSCDNKKHTSISSNSKGLVDIALKTITLIRRNQLLQKKLLQLQVETKEFIKSVMANPENRVLCNKQLNEQSILSQNDN